LIPKKHHKQSKTIKDHQKPSRLMSLNPSICFLRHRPATGHHLPQLVARRSFRRAIGGAGEDRATPVNLG